MYLGVAAGLLLAVAGGGHDPDGSAPFAAPLPAAVGDVSRWQIVAGSFETTTESGSYRLYVSPARLALYQLIRYRVELHGATNPEERARGGAERVVFVPRPGMREPMLCWVRVSGSEPSWREVPAGTPEYALEMAVVIRVLGVHRAARLAQP